MSPKCPAGLAAGRAEVQPAQSDISDVPRSDSVGLFRYSPTTGEWEWDEVTSRLHGLPPQRRMLATDALLELVYAEDRDPVVAELAAKNHARLKMHYRIVVSGGAMRHLLAVAHPTADPGGTWHAEGHIVEITAELRGAGQVAVEAAIEGRGVIDQAKGAVMVAYGLTDDQAFALLRWWSRNHNTRVRLLAERLMATARNPRYSHEELRRAFDRVMHDVATATPEG